MVKVRRLAAEYGIPVAWGMLIIVVYAVAFAVVDRPATGAPFSF